MAEETAGKAALPTREFKDMLAFCVFGLSIFGIMAVGLVYSISGKPDSSREVFSTLVPLFGTWIGTILAFYFSRENFREANAAVSRIVDRVTPEQQLAATLVRDAMMKRAAIKGRKLAEGEDENVIPLDELVAFFDEYSRALIFAPGDVIKYVIHKSMLDAYVTGRMREPVLADAVAPQPLQGTLKDLFAYRIGEQTCLEIAKRFAFVRESATLADARSAMLAVKGCEDVFVTQSGKVDEPVLGWLTNTDITRDL